MASSAGTAHSRAIAAVVVSVVFETLALIAMILRFYSHRLRKRRIAAHDWASVVALIFSSGCVVLVITAVAKGGLGQHTWELSNPTIQLQHFAKIYVANSPVWAGAISAVKVSIVLLYIGLFGSARTIRYCCYTLITLQILWGAAVILSSLLLCKPLRMNWDPTADGHCGSTEATYLALHIINLILDVTVGLLPVPVLWKLQMKRRKKIELTLMFALGIAICIITVFRVNMINDLVSTDPTYTTTPLMIFTILEPLLGIILACLPLLRPVFERVSAFRTLHSSCDSRGSGTSTPQLFGQSGESKAKAERYVKLRPSTSTAGFTHDINGTATNRGHGYELDELRCLSERNKPSILVIGLAVMLSPKIYGVRPG
ncbi:uncharacterized protein ANIA_10886 [Aspergillus nidulans FGSC A4]|uniref:Rhodopsin domain-containing protein n=1 Tax=Emericella nidulans (strain FGSC A4 / ATCC 38163 / CBS 112.46 / NRRL 194 / M139) TaxID=227321 RepID=C8VDF5_EMENI|nr:hypothetical protein [Aspergillus nidulans FGSC A4]CBF79121.1 TPA: conserved hypothetical protein [Aspergillus nidulans FGSC A4]